ncbi:MAG: acyl carrier protein [Prevotella sp.]|jgi:acyl carrier protein|nr:acyl carrier protein [Prevotella sp.]
MRERIKDILKETFDLDEVPEDITQETCADWDSLRHLHLIIGLETEFNVSFEPEDIADMKSLDKIENKIKDLQE